MNSIAEDDDNLPEQFQDIPMEFRLLQKKFDHQKIFTQASNEVRLDNILRAHNYKEEHRTDKQRDAKPVYMSKIDNNLDMFREIENIIDQEMTNGLQAQMMKRSLLGIRPQEQEMNKSKSAGYIKARKKQTEKLPSIKRRYGRGVVSNWQKGPIDMPKDRYFDLNDSTIYGGSKDARARQLRQQTKLLMNSFQTTNKHANMNAVCRKRLVDESKDKGEDHVVGSFDEILSAQQEMDRTTKISINDQELLSEVTENVKYRKRIMKRKASSRILELWDLFQCPQSSKLSFKLQSEQRMPDTTIVMGSPKKGDSSVRKDKVTTPQTIISRLENLADGVHAFNVVVLLLRLWRERNYPAVYTSTGLTQPIIDLCRSGGMEKCLPAQGENMQPWLSRLCEELWKLLIPQLRFWIQFSQDHLDKHFTTFIENLNQDLCEFLAVMEEDQMTADENATETNATKTTANETNTTDETTPTKTTKNKKKKQKSPNKIETVHVTNLNSSTEAIIKQIDSYDPHAQVTEDTTETNIMKDKSVKYHNMDKLSKKTQNIYENLPAIVDSVNINKVSKNLMKTPNKMLHKRLAKHQFGLGDDEDGDY